jgi:hypothetical protein
LLALLCILAVVGTALNYKWLVVGKGDENTILLYTHRIIDEDFLKNDWFVNAEFAGFNIRFFFGYLTAPVIAVLGDKLGGLIIYLFNLFFLCLAAFLLGREFWDGSAGAGILSALVALTTLGLQTVGFAYVTISMVPQAIGLTLVTFATYALLRGRLKTAAALQGAATLINLVLGLSTTLALGLAALLSGKARIRQALAPAAIYAIIAGWNVIPLALRDVGDDALTSAEWVRTLSTISPAGFTLSTWGFWQWLPATILVFFAVWTALRARPQEWGRARFLPALLGVIGFLFLAGYFFTEVVPSKAVVNVHFFRLAGLAYLFGAVALAGLIVSSLRGTRSWAVAAGCAALMLSAHLTVVSRWALIPLLAGGAMLVTGGMRSLERISMPLAHIAAVLVLALATGAALAALSGSVRPLTLAGNYAGLFTLFMLVPQVVVGRLGRRTSLALVVCALAALFVAANSVRIHLDIKSQEKDLDDMYRFIREQTDPDAVFLISPDHQRFRLEARRAAVIDAQSFSYFDRYTREHMRRRQDISKNLTLVPGDIVQQMAAGYLTLNASDVMALSQKYDFAYALFPASKVLGFPVAYRNAGWVLHRVPETA